jgi:flagellin
MSLRINQNIDALNSYRNLSVTQGQMSKSLEKLSSGYRINRAADDAAGLAISEGLRSQVGGIKVAVRNAQDGVSVVQTAEGALTETHSILQRMRDLAVQSANDSNDDNSRSAIDEESQALQSELTRIAEKTTFNNINLLDGSFSGKDFQVGYAAGDTITVNVTGGGTAAHNDFTASTITAAGTFTFTQVADTTAGVAAVSVTTGSIGVTKSAQETADALNNDAVFASSFHASVYKDGSGNDQVKVNSTTGNGSAIVGATTTTGATVSAAGTAASATGGGFSAADLGVSVSLTTKANATSAITSIDAAIKTVSTSRAKLGALQNRFEHTINNLSVTQENLTASESRIRDTDMASEMMSYTRSQILSQAGTAMLAQANQAPQGVLSLLRG